MKICHINLAREYRGGERQTELLVCNLAKRGMSQRVIARKGSRLADRLCCVAGVELRDVRYPVLGHFDMTRGVDLMHVHEGKSQQTALLHHWLRKIPYIVTRRIPNPPGKHLGTRTGYRHASCVVALSKAIEKTLRDYDETIQVRTIPSMLSELSVDKENLKGLRQKYRGKFVVGHVGALQMRNKGQQYLVEAARLLSKRSSSLHFVLVGEGEDRGALEDLAKDLPNVTFVGFSDSVGDYLSLFDIFVFPSVKEGLGSILLDVMQFRKPIIASATGGIPELIVDGENGLLVSPQNAVELAEAIEKLYDDGTLRETFVKNGVNRIADYSADKITDAYLKLYREILGYGRN